MLANIIDENRDEDFRTAGAPIHSINCRNLLAQDTAKEIESRFWQGCKLKNEIELRFKSFNLTSVMVNGECSW